MVRNPFSKRPLVPVIRLEGVIGASARPGGSAINDSVVASAIERAFRGKPPAVALQINSPGGSPVQSALIAARIRRLADEKGVRVYAFCEDVAASGGYWLATAADEIYVDAGSIVGSIGVITATFGLHEFIARHGIERRVYTAGEDKSILDPFRPERERDIVRLKQLQQDLHGIFIDHVKTRRGARLADADLFTGDIFIGGRAVELGLADGIAHLVPKMKALFGDKTRFKVSKPKRGLLSRLGVAAPDLIGAVEDRAAWARFGV
ncbi:S49 family peptidase [Rhodobacteraceae bacterium 2CG4]|uniref:S49 family peptidase n=1 Tax=Halovulum marinum TaxID=2662447 RepID=A0A6L5Z5K4_9RHOB|nr:S49 family peptidase [Halovulum marinum]MSU91324.1 S49 family peptidase [Halovulum marinum]